MIWKDSTVALFEVLTQNSLRVTKNNYETESRNSRSLSQDLKTRNPPKWKGMKKRLSLSLAAIAYSVLTL